MHPLCVHCNAKGIVSLAVELDHIVALENGGKDFDVDDGTNRQGLCAECHAEKTRIDNGWRPISGADLAGMPTDPSHPWNVRD